MIFEKSFKSYSNDQWLLCRKQVRFNMTNILYALVLNQNIIDERIIITLRNGQWKVKSNY
jgi:hypothetical protein